ncbi:YggS family pyridoxal phosphate-dependent enzyme [bacterium]|nr:YggS family pyridoxal phosphate-dependent enzyme [bacterium]
MVAERIRHIEKRMADACERAGRSLQEVTLVAVTKTQPPETVNELLQTGILEIGENRVQEYLRKKDALAPHHLHMIGHLQRNKVKYLVGEVAMIHSVDSVDLAKEIDRRSASAGCMTDILLEVNTSGEESKFGFTAETAFAAVNEILPLTSVRLRGLMTVAEFVDDPELVRPAFQRLRALRERIVQEYGNGDMVELSMGMTNDFEVAIEEGATIVRIGSAIFGPRE